MCKGADQPSERQERLICIKGYPKLMELGEELLEIIVNGLDSVTEGQMVELFCVGTSRNARRELIKGCERPSD